MSDKTITFIATFPSIASAITISGDGSGLRIKLDIPETELMPALSLLAMRQSAFRITIEPIRDDKTKTDDNRTNAVKRTTAKKRNRQRSDSL